MNSDIIFYIIWGVLLLIGAVAVLILCKDGVWSHRKKKIKRGGVVLLPEGNLTRREVKRIIRRQKKQEENDMSEKKEEQAIKAAPTRMIVEIDKAVMGAGQYEIKIEILADKRYVCSRIIPRDFFKDEWDYLWDYAKKEMEAVIFKE